MGIKKISELPAASAVGPDDEVVLVQAGATRRAPASAFVAGGAVPGYQVAAAPLGFYLAASGSFSTAGRTVAFPLTLVSPMYVASLVLRCTTAAAGVVQWGLFNPASGGAAAAAKVAGGSGSLSATGVREIAADSGPVLVAPGNYILAVSFPASACPTVSRQLTASTNTAPGIAQRYKDGLALGATLDLTAGWVDDVAVLWTYLRGRLNATATW